MRALFFVIALLISASATPQRSYIRDPSGMNLGYTMEQRGRVTAYSRSGVRLGYYDARTNKTYDRGGRIIAQGNVVAGLIRR